MDNNTPWSALEISKEVDCSIGYNWGGEVLHVCSLKENKFSLVGDYN